MNNYKLVLIFDEDSSNGETEVVFFQATEENADNVATELFNTTDAGAFYVEEA